MCNRPGCFWPQLAEGEPFPEMTLHPPGRPHAAAPAIDRITGYAVWKAWRDGMIVQGRAVAAERMAWETLDQRDRDLDDGIAVALAASPDPREETTPAPDDCPVHHPIGHLLYRVRHASSECTKEALAAGLAAYLASLAASPDPRPVNAEPTEAERHIYDIDHMSEDDD